MAELTDAQKVLRNDTGKRIAAAIEALGGTPPIDLGMTGASVGQVPVINTVDANGAPTSYRPGDGGGASMTILSYGISTWNDFVTAYNSNSIVYCRASSAADPSSGSQTRLAFMAYVNNASSPTSVEFQYYRSVSGHTASQQGDQVFIYRLTSAGVWSVETRNTFTQIAAGTNMTSSYANGTLTLNATGGGTEDALPLAGGTMAGAIDMGGNKITNVPTPTHHLDAANKNYVDARYIKPSNGIPKSDLASAVQTSLGKADTALQAVPSTYRTAAAQDAIDEDILGNLATIESSPATAAHAVGEYIVYNGQLYKVTAAISPGETLTPGTNIAAVSGGGLNDLKNEMIFDTIPMNTATLNAHTNQRFSKSVAKTGYKAIGLIGVAGIGPSYLMGEFVNYSGQTAELDVYNFSGSAIEITPIAIVLYKRG